MNRPPPLLSLRSAVVLLLATMVAWVVYQAHDPSNPALVPPIAAAIAMGLVAAGLLNRLIAEE